jgi:salicylate hydroxylase
MVSPYYQIHRVDLHAALLEAVSSNSTRRPCSWAPGPIEVQEDEHMRVRSCSTDGRKVRADLLVGARRHQVGGAQARGRCRPGVFTGRWLGACPSPSSAFPCNCAHPCGLVDLVRPQKPRRDVLHALPAMCSTLSAAWSALGKKSRGLRVKPWEELDQDYAGWHPIVRAAIDNVDRDQCFRWALNNRKPVMNWCTDRVALLGDAVHPTLPYMAQGAAMAIEDAAVLSRALALDMPMDAGFAGLSKPPCAARCTRGATSPRRCRTCTTLPTRSK